MCPCVLRLQNRNIGNLCVGGIVINIISLTRIVNREWTVWILLSDFALHLSNTCSVGVLGHQYSSVQSKFNL